MLIYLTCLIFYNIFLGKYFIIEYKKTNANLLKKYISISFQTMQKNNIHINYPRKFVYYNKKKITLYNSIVYYCIIYV